MGTRIKDFENRFHLEKTFQGPGVIGGDSYKRRGESRLRAVVEGVGSTNAIQFQGKLTGQAAWQNVGSAITSTSAGTTVDISNYDEWRANCTTYEGADDTAEVQTIGFSAVPDAGAWKLSYGGVETASLVYNANAAAVQAALRAISGLESVTVTGDYTSGFTITFGFETGDAALLVEAANTLTASAVAVTTTIAEDTAGDLGEDDAKLIVSGFYD